MRRRRLNPTCEVTPLDQVIGRVDRAVQPGADISMTMRDHSSVQAPNNVAA
jgi:hypothetical protein